MNQKLTRLLRPYLWVSMFIMLFCAAIAVYYSLYSLALAEALGAIVLFGYSAMNTRYQKRQLMRYMEQTMNGMETTRLVESPVPKVTFDVDTGEILWAGERFLKILGTEDPVIGRHMQDVIPELDTSFVADDSQHTLPEFTYNTRRYQLYGNVILSEQESRRIANLFFVDSTSLLKIRDEYLRSRPIVSLILIDNYDELTKNQSENDVSALNVAINTTVMNWAAGRGGLLRKIDRNRYLFIFERRYLAEMIEQNFALLEEIRKVVNNAGIQATVSLGIGKDGTTFEESLDFASLSQEMALSRGGDQAVIKDRYSFNFYGGRGLEGSTRSPIRARTVANTLLELIAQSSQVFIMGHANADLDVLGAAAGIMAICRKKHTPAKIVMDMQQNAVQTLLTVLQPLPAYEDAFISGENALISADSKSLLIIVDTNRPEQVQYQPLLASMSRVVVIDHHRRAADYIENDVLNFQETSASSASELTADLLQFSVDPTDILREEAIALLAGIVLDTKQFSVRTADKTFEAAAFLRRLGADPVEVKRLLQSDFNTAMKRYEIIQKARILHDNIAISVMDKDVGRVTAAQAADELINISDISCSFVLFPTGDKIAISGRSIGDINVQLILETLGGGGNPAAAGAQIPDTDINTAVEDLVASIQQYLDTTHTNSITETKE